MKEFDEEMEEVFGVSEVEYDSMNFVVGEKFSSYQQLEEKITAYQDGDNIQLVYTNSQTLDALEKRAPKRVQKANDKLRYYFLHLTCNLGGKQFQCIGSGQRTHHRYSNCLNFTLI